MAELLFIATIIFVAYVVFVVMGEKKETSEPSKPEEAQPEIKHPEVEKPVLKESKAEVTQTPSTVVKSAAKPRSKAASSKSATPKPAAAKAASTSTTASTAPAPVSAVADDSLKNPKTGEIAKVPSTYSFAKRWIKDALVEEGLLEKVYKNNELDDAANAKIQQALQQLKAMDKYR